MSDSFVNPMDYISHQDPLSMGFPRQEYWSGLPFPFPGALPDTGIEPVSPALTGRFFTTEPPESPFYGVYTVLISLYLHNDPVRQGPLLSSIFQTEKSQQRLTMERLSDLPEITQQVTK